MVQFSFSKRHALLETFKKPDFIGTYKDGEAFFIALLVDALYIKHEMVHVQTL